MTVSQYIQQVQRLYKTGLSSEHSYRGDLRTLLESLVTDAMVTNEPRRIACGAPDYIITRNDIPVGYIEAKDIGKDIGHKDYKEQFGRYKKSLNNLIITDYIDFWFYVDGELTTKVKIADIEAGQIRPLPLNYDHFIALIKNFCTYVGQTIRSSQKLAIMMAAKAKLLSNAIESALLDEADIEENDTLQSQLHAFKDVLIHDIKPKEFADIYAQTIAYGMFAARLHDTTLNTFTRQEAAELIPKSNPFLRKLFQYVAGVDLDFRIVWIVDALADIFRATDVAALLQNFGKSTQTRDPIIHFYETFLAEYDPALRKARGVWYTPEPVVNFIVRAVDDILKTEFELPKGLADTTKIKIRQKVVTKATSDQRSKLKEVETEIDVHKVQILDPATGTGTFLAEVVKHVYKGFEGQKGIWSNYVENHLIPRLNGFELLMASYAMAHLKMDILLAETGFRSTKNQRFRIYLTNSLEEHHQDTGTIFANWLSTEANEANHIKRDTPVMVILGNPPYSGHSSNSNPWINNLIEDYKKEPTGGKLKEQNSKWLNDDYVKFIRYAQMFIDKNEDGVLAFITNNGYLDNPTFRGMRYNLLKSFNKIYSIDLHGSSKKQEKTKDGSQDKNVFDIQQGVSIFIAIKNKNKKGQSEIQSFDLLGTRDFKYRFLQQNSLSQIDFNKFTPISPNYLFKEVNQTLNKTYELGINPLKLFKINVMGFQTHRDSFAIGWDDEEIVSRASILIDKNISNENIYSRYEIADNRDWKLDKSRKEIQADQNWKERITKISYRPFDNRSSYFSYVMMDYPRKELIQNVLNKENLILGIGRQGIAVGDISWCLTTISRCPIDANVFRRGGVNLFPLYLYADNSSQLTIDQDTQRQPNLDKDIIKQIGDAVELTFTNEKEHTEKTFAPIDILEYIYAILYSPTYREKYKEFLKGDFPRIPYPKDPETFWKLVKLGSQLREFHLLESKEVDNYITGYPQDGDNIVVKTSFDAGKVYINETQYFENVPEIAWNFYIGGYQPAQKWLKDRKGRELSFDDILHYQRMIVALTETDRLMQEIDKIEFE